MFPVSGIVYEAADQFPVFRGHEPLSQLPSVGVTSLASGCVCQHSRLLPQKVNHLLFGSFNKWLESCEIYPASHPGYQSIKDLKKPIESP